MTNTIWAVVQDGKILPQEPIELYEGHKVLVTILLDEENKFWMDTANVALDAIWGNKEDDIYAELLAA